MMNEWRIDIKKINNASNITNISAQGKIIQCQMQKGILCFTFSVSFLKYLIEHDDDDSQ